MDETTRLIQQRVDTLPAGLQAHIHRVREIAQELAPHHDVDPREAAVGALAHDVARAMSDSELIYHCMTFGLPIGMVDRQLPVLLHGPVGAKLLRSEDAHLAESLSQAVYWHTTSHLTLDKLGKVIFLADKLDPMKIQRYPYQPRLRELAETDLDQAILEFLTREMISLASNGHMVHPVMIETRNHLLSS